MTLEQKIERYFELKEAYYIGEPLVTDEEFDIFEEELIAQGFDPVVGYVIDSIEDIPQERKVTHRHRMLSLGKQKCLTEELPIDIATALYDKYQRFGVCVMSWKYDGLALDLHYDNGLLQSISTRGNGSVGINVMNKFKHLVPNELSIGFTGNVRGELVMNQRLFEEKYSAHYAHSRNLVAGICNDIDVNDERKFDVEFIALEAIDEIGRLEQLKSLHRVWLDEPTSGYTSAKAQFTLTSAEELRVTFNRLAKIRSTFDYGTDGVVISSWFTSGLREHQLQWRHNGKYPEHAIAVKFKPPTLTSVVTEIKWKLQKTRKYVPIVYFEPIQVDGRTIKQATGHNIEYLHRHNIVPGQIVNIVLANDIIPQVKMQ